MQLQGRGPTEQATKQRKTRSDKKHKVLPALDFDTHHKLKRLALACDITKTELAAAIIKMAVNHPEIIKWFQDKHPGPKEFRVIPVRHPDGRIEY
ncbi:hypothetical protein [Paenibacillus validus]|uniref:hypothetical protein n=1 Tax=Paenibacillus validus TaxID=44253 RepID=UPI003D298B80